MAYTRLIAGWLLGLLLLVAQPSPLLAALCQNQVSWDVVLVIDVSGSMNDQADPNDTTNKITAAIRAAINFSDNLLAANSKNRIGLVAFSTSATLKTPLTANPDTIRQSILSLTANGGTCLQCGIRLANTELATENSLGNTKAAIILTDGLPSAYLQDNGTSVIDVVPSPTRPTDNPISQRKSLDEATAGWNTGRVNYFSVGIGSVNQSGLNPTLLRNISSVGSTEGSEGFYKYVADAGGIEVALSKIIRVIGSGMITGTVYLDANKDSTFNTANGDQGISGITVALYDSTHTLVSQTTTGSDGSYIFQSICNGNYAIKVLNLPNSFIQTSPPSGGSNSVRITTANPRATEENFALVPAPVYGMNLQLRSSGYITNSSNIQADPGTPWPTGKGNAGGGFAPTVDAVATTTDPSAPDPVTYYVWLDCNGSETQPSNVTSCGTPLQYSHTASSGKTDTFTFDNRINYQQPGAHLLKVIVQRGTTYATATVPVNVINLTFQARSTTITSGTAPAFQWTTGGQVDQLDINGQLQTNITANQPTPGFEPYTIYTSLLTTSQSFTATARNSHGRVQASLSIDVTPGNLPGPTVSRFCLGE